MSARDPGTRTTLSWSFGAETIQTSSGELLFELNVTLWTERSHLRLFDLFLLNVRQLGSLTASIFLGGHFISAVPKWLTLEILISTVMATMMKTMEIQQGLFNLIIIQLQDHQVNNLKWQLWTESWERKGRRWLRHPLRRELIYEVKEEHWNHSWQWWVEEPRSLAYKFRSMSTKEWSWQNVLGREKTL